MFKNLLNNLAGNPIERELNRLSEVVEEINALEPEMAARSSDDLRALTEELKDRVYAAVEGIEDPDAIKAAEKEALTEILPMAFAAVREASRRTLGLRHFDVQMIGGVALHEGKIAEMKTGEGKTLVATLPLYLNALTGRGAHLVTVNDYLARRDGGWMGPIFHLLGLRTGVIGKENTSAIYDPDYVDPGGDLEDERLVHWKPALRRECYEVDITYGTAPEFGFDYLRDNTVLEPERLVQRDLVYAIVDEVDSVLIDGARTPLIISGPAAQASAQYVRFAQIIDQARLRRNTTDLEHDEEPDGDYILDDRTQSVALTDEGTEKIERALPEIDPAAGQSLYDPQFYELVHFLENALKAKYIFKRDKDYIVQQGQVVIIDQTTGRPMPSRRYSEGLHQAIEAKEGVQVKREDITIATITVQNYFRLYEKLSGMTGTAVTQAEEFDKVYELDVIPIPTNVEYIAANGELIARKEKVEGVTAITYWEPDHRDGPAYFQRVDFDDQVYTTVGGKFLAVAEEIKALVEAGRPALVGTGSVEASEELSRILKQMKLEHTVLNAKNHDKEALIVAQAGQPGAITISTSMAGRGTDILLGGNPEGLASSYVTDACFTMPAFAPVVKDVVDGNRDQAARRAAADPLLGKGVVEWIETGLADLQRKAAVEDVVNQVIKDVRESGAYADLSYDALVEVAQQTSLGVTLDYRRIERARRIAEEKGAPATLVADIQFRINDYMQAKGQIAQHGLADTLARHLFEQHFNARAALARATLADQVEEAERVRAAIPALPDTLIAGIQDLRRACEDARQSIWEQGGLHVIGTERHESRRIDNQLRGRAARQGDPGSSRFYLSLEDDLMIRFGGNRGKALLDRLNIPEDMPIAAGILSGVIEQAQSRFETFYFEMRKNLVEYDEAVNLQRGIVYTERKDILQGDTGKLDDLLRTFIQDSLTRQIERLRAGYQDWAMQEVNSAIEDFANLETGEVNTRGLVQRVQSLFPRLSPEDMLDLLQITHGGELTSTLEALIADAVEQNHHLTMLFYEIARIVPPFPPLPPVTQHGVEGWESFAAETRAALAAYANHLADDDRDALDEELAEKLEEAFKTYQANAGKGVKPQEAQAILYNQIANGFGDVFREVIDAYENDELMDVLMARVDELLEIAHRPVQPGETSPMAIGPEEMASYQRALMLSVLDAEWRQYLTAIDDLRQGIGLEAFGQRDPKIEFKRRSAQMFDTLRADTQEGIARRFFAEMGQHRAVIEQQKEYERFLDRLALSGYRVQQKTQVNDAGQVVKVAQTVRKDVWSNVGRNDPCPCGSGKKFKDCHYREIMKQQSTVSQSEVFRTSGGKKRGRRR